MKRNQKGVSSSSIILSQFIPIYLLCSKLIPLHHLFPILHIMLINVLVGHDFLRMVRSVIEIPTLVKLLVSDFCRFIVQFNNVHRYQRIEREKQLVELIYATQDKSEQRRCYWSFNLIKAQEATTMIDKTKSVIWEVRHLEGGKLLNWLWLITKIW